MRKGLSYLAYGVAAGVVLVGASHDALRAAGSSTNDKLALFAEVFNKVRDNYAEKPDDEKMIKSAIDGMLASLDPHSNYFDPKALQDFQSSMKGEEFGGLGLEVMMENGLVKVVSPIDDTPAARAGMMSGDLVTRIDDTAVKGLSLKEAVDKMRGPGQVAGQADRRARIERGTSRSSRSSARSSMFSRCARISRAATSAISASPSSTRKRTTGCARPSIISAPNPARRI